MMKCLKDARTVPIQIRADGKSRLQIPFKVRQMFGYGPGDRFELHITADNELYYKAVKK